MRTLALLFHIFPLARLRPYNCNVRCATTIYDFLGCGRSGQLERSSFILPPRCDRSEDYESETWLGVAYWDCSNSYMVCVPEDIFRDLLNYALGKRPTSHLITKLLTILATSSLDLMRITVWTLILVRCLHSLASNHTPTIGDHEWILMNGRFTRPPSRSELQSHRWKCQYHSAKRPASGQLSHRL